MADKLSEIFKNDLHVLIELSVYLKEYFGLIHLCKIELLKDFDINSLSYFIYAKCLIS